MTSDFATDFATNGFFTIAELLDEETCSSLLLEVLTAFCTGSPQYVHSPYYRIHRPLPLSETVRSAITRVLEPAYYTAEVFLGSDRRLVELSSITVFPGAESQPFHPDETNPETSLLSVFVNLAATHRAAGALRVIPHSHLTSSEVVRAHSSFDESRAEVLELPAGSATFMNSKLVHSGGANTSRDRIRAVLYFTFGKPGLRGPAYSILPDVEDLKLSLEAFSPRAGLRRDGWTQESKPRLHEGYKLTRGFPETIHSAKVYLVDEFDEIVRGIELDPPDEWIAVVLRDVSSHGGHWTARNLAEHANVDVGMVLQALGTLGRDGWLSW